MRRAERHALRGVVALVPLAAILQFAWGSFPPGAPSAQDRGRLLYEVSCMSCHGPGARGTSDGPSLQDVGAAAIDFQLSTGRMPLGDPTDPPRRREPVFSRADIDAIIRYVTGIAGPGIPIPDVDPGRGTLALGQQLFAEGCAACHGVGGGGDSIGGSQIAPSLAHATPLQVAEAIRVGPGAMPRFGSELVDQRELDSLAAYVAWLQTSGDPGGLGLGRIGPVAEGFTAAILGLGALVLVIRFTGTRS